MKPSNSHPTDSSEATTRAGVRQANSGSIRRPDAGRRGRDPLDYQHRHASLGDFARLLVLRYDLSRTWHSYYRQMRLISDHFGCDPATLSEEQLRDYILHVKTRKQWKPKTIRQAAAAARMFYVDQLGHSSWTVFSQIRARDEEHLPAMLTRPEVIALLRHIRLRRYRTPIKLIYCCGLRLSECLNLTVHDIDGDGGKLWVRGGKGGKGGKDRMVPIATHLVEAGASIHTVKDLLGHRAIETTMIYLHLTHRSRQDCRELVERLCLELPR